jgi:hypothetical protein
LLELDEGSRRAVDPPDFDRPDFDPAVLREPPDLLLAVVLLAPRERVALEPLLPFRFRLEDARFEPDEDPLRLPVLFALLPVLFALLLLDALLLPDEVRFVDVLFVFVVAMVSLLQCQLREPDLRVPLGLEPLRLFPDDPPFDRERPEDADVRSVFRFTSPSSMVPRQPPSSSSCISA